MQLMNKDRAVLEVEEDAGTLIKMGAVLNEEFLPIQLQRNLTINTLNDWFKKRRIPEKREGLEQARASFAGFEKDLRYFSLSDQYWIRRNKNDTWDKYNFFTNFYDREVGRIFFEPWNVIREHIEKPSPDRTTTGVLTKRWVQDEGGVSYLIKAGSTKYHQEPLSEVLASIMLKKMNMIDFVPYELVIDGFRFCSKCKNFVDADSEFVPASAIYMREQRRQGETIYEHLIKMCESYGIEGVQDYLDRMVVADHVLCNPDRHLNNFGFLRSASTGKILGFAPLFDCGSSYWGTQNNVTKKRSNLFPDMEEEILKKAARKGLLADIRSTKSMQRLIHGYPDIPAAKKEALYEEIKQMDLEMESRSAVGPAEETISIGEEERDPDKFAGITR